MADRGALTRDELFAVLRSTVDKLYLEPFLEQGYGTGLESFEALCELLARAARAIDTSTQSMFVSPWSGQTAPPAAGAAPGVIAQFEIARSARFAVPLTIRAGQVLFEEVQTDWARGGGVEVATGRRFTLLDDVTFLPGEEGPIVVQAVSTGFGYGYGNPLPDSIRRIVQEGSGFSNDRAALIQGATSAALQVWTVPNVVVPEHVGQYVEILSGANAGVVRLVGGYQPPNLAVPHGGVAALLPIFGVRAMVVGPIGTFIDGETVEQTTGGATNAIGRVRRVSTSGPPWYAVIEASTGAFAVTAGPVSSIIGQSSGASFALEAFEEPQFLTTELTGVAWRVLDWSADFGLSVRNVEAPEHGALAVLDELGNERGIARAPGESDDSYRKRVAQVPDTVSPNAVRRAGNRIWAPLGGSVCLREVGNSRFPGLFDDGDPGSTTTLAAYAYDFDAVRANGAGVGVFFEHEQVEQVGAGGAKTTGRIVSLIAAGTIGLPTPPPPAGYIEIAGIRGPGFAAGLPIVGLASGATWTPTGFVGFLRASDRFKLLLDYLEFRAFFLLGVPPSDAGDFGVAFDAGSHNAFDAFPYLAFYDGFPATTAVLYRSTWQAIDAVRAAGVGFDLYLEASGCAA